MEYAKFGNGFVKRETPAAEWVEVKGAEIRTAAKAVEDAQLEARNNLRASLGRPFARIIRANPPE